MKDHDIESSVQRHRERQGLSQKQLADRVGVARQTILAIEAGKQVPSTALALLMARSLGCAVEDLFTLAPSGAISARVAVRSDPGGAARLDGRVTLGLVDGEWVAHGPVGHARDACDGILSAVSPDGWGAVRPLSSEDDVLRNVLVAGCAPLLGLLTDRIGRRFHDARATWIEATSLRSLDLLADALVHVAGVHLFGPGSEEVIEETIRRRFPRERMLVVNLTRWRQGIVVPRGNPGGIRSPADLVRSDVRVAIREEGSVADALVRRMAAEEGVDDPVLRGPHARGHEDVARLVQCGAADAGVAIEAVALAAGLGFVPLAEERFDLVVPSARVTAAPVSRLLDGVTDRVFRTEATCLPGYDTSLTGRVTTVDAA